MNLTTAQEMAVEVLLGNVAAARALADKLVTEVMEGAVQVMPTRRVTVEENRVRVVLYVREDQNEAVVDMPRCLEDVENWIRHGGPLVLTGIERMDVYELPPRG